MQVGDHAYQGSGIGAVEAKESLGGLHVGAGSRGKGPRRHRSHGEGRLGGSSPDGAESLSREHGGRLAAEDGGLVEGIRYGGRPACSRLLLRFGNFGCSLP